MESAPIYTVSTIICKDVLYACVKCFRMWIKLCTGFQNYNSSGFCFKVKVTISIKLLSILVKVKFIEEHAGRDHLYVVLHAALSWILIPYSKVMEVILESADLQWFQFQNRKPSEYTVWIPVPLVQDSKQQLTAFKWENCAENLSSICFLPGITLLDAERTIWFIVRVLSFLQTLYKEAGGHIGSIYVSHQGWSLGFATKSIVTGVCHNIPTYELL